MLLAISLINLQNIIFNIKQMFEKLIADLLNTFLGAFVEELNKDQLGASIYSGKIELRNQRLKKNLFDPLGVPLKLQCGMIGRIFIKIPLWDMFKSPVVVEISDLIGIVRTTNIFEWSQEEQRRAFVEAQQGLLERFELLMIQKAMLASIDADQKKGAKGEQQASFLNKLVDRIINNLKITLTNIYFRFEDKLLSPPPLPNNEQHYVLGIKLKGLYLKTCDSKYEEVEDSSKLKESGEMAKLNFKKLLIEDLSIFCDWKDSDLPENGFIYINKIDEEHQKIVKGELKDGDDLYYRQILQAEFTDDPDKKIKHKDILDNFLLEVKTQLNKDIRNPLHPASFEHPQISLKVLLGRRSEDGRMGIAVYQPQLLRIMKTVELIGLYNEFDEGAVALLQCRHLTDSEVYKYMGLYESWYKLENSKKKDAKQVEDYRSQMKKIEVLVSAQEIISIRQIQMQKFQSSEAKQADLDELEARIKNKIWEKKGLGLFMSAEDKKKIEDDVRASFDEERAEIERKHDETLDQLSQQAKKLVDELKSECQDPDHVHGEHKKEEQKTEKVDLDKLFQVEDDGPELPPGFVFFDLGFELPHLNVTFDNEFDQRLCDTRIEKVSVILSFSKDYFGLDVSLYDLYTDDLWTEAKDYPQLLKLKADDGHECDEPAVRVKFEIKDDNKICPEILTIKINKNLWVYFKISFLLEIWRSVDEAVNGQEVDLKYYQKAYTGAQSQFKAYAAEGIASAVKSKSKVDQSHDTINQRQHDMNTSLNNSTGGIQNQSKSKSQEKYHFSMYFDLKLKGPVIVMPYQNIYSSDSCQSVELRLGEAECTTELLPYHEEINYQEMQVESLLYDLYQIQFDGFSLAIVESGQDPLYLINDINYQVDFYNCLDELHPQFHTFKINAYFKKPVNFQVEERLITQIINIYMIVDYEMRAENMKLIQKQLKQRQVSKDKEQLDLQDMVQKNLVQGLRDQYSKSIKNMKRKSIIQIRQGKAMKQNLPKLLRNKTHMSSQFKDQRLPIMAKIPSEQVPMPRKLTKNSKGLSVKFEPQADDSDHSSDKKDSIETDSDLDDIDAPSVSNLINNSNARVKRRFTSQGGFTYMAAQAQKKQYSDLKLNFQMNDFSIKVLSSTCEHFGMHQDGSKERNGVIFEMKNFETQVIVDNNFNDTAVDLTVQTIQVRLSHCDSPEADIFDKILSSPYDDNFSKQLSRKLSRKTLPDGSEVSAEKQIQVQVFSKFKQGYDASTQLTVNKTEINVACVINRIRILYNIPTFVKLMIIHNDFYDLLYNPFLASNTCLTEHRIRDLQRFVQLTGAPQCGNVRKIEDDEIELLRKQLQNQALLYPQETDEKYYQDCFGYMAEHVWAETTQLFGKQSTSTWLVVKNDTQKKFRGFFDHIKEFQNQIGQETFDVSNIVKINKVLTQNPNKKAKDYDHRHFYIIKIQPQEYVINIKMKLKNAQLWICDYDQSEKKSQERAQILQMSFSADFFEEREDLSRYITSSRVKPPKKVLYRRQTEMGSALYGATVGTQGTLQKRQRRQESIASSPRSSVSSRRSQSLTKKETIRKRMAQRGVLNRSFQQSELSRSRSGSVDSSIQSSGSQDSMETDIPQTELADEEEPSGKYDHPKNLVYETKQLSYKSSQQINCTKLKAQQLIVSKWIYVEPVAQKLFVKQHTRENRQNHSKLKKQDTFKTDKDSSFDKKSDQSSVLDGYDDSATQKDPSAYSGPPMNFKDVGYDSEVNMSGSNSDKMSQGMMEMQENYLAGKSDFYFAKTTMLQPTSISLLLVYRQQYRKINFSDVKMSMEPISCKFDFKDMDLVYYLYQRQLKEYYLGMAPVQEISENKAEEQKSQAAQSNEEKAQLQVGKQETQVAITDAKEEKEAPEYKTVVSNMHIEIKSIIFVLSDGDYKNFIGDNLTPPVPLLEICISDFFVKQRTCKAEKNQNPFMAMTMSEFIERYTSLRAVFPPFTTMDMNMKLYATYFNQMSQAFEPFMEPWAISVTIKQDNPSSHQDVKIFSGEQMNINLSYGLAYNIMIAQERMMTKLRKIDQLIDPEITTRSMSQQQSVQYTNRSAQVGATRQDPAYKQNRQEGLLVSQKTKIEDDFDDDNQSNKSEDYGGEKSNVSSGKSGYKFYNYSGMPMKFCITDDILDDELELPITYKRQLMTVWKHTISEIKKDKVIKMKGAYDNSSDLIQPVFREHTVFEQQLNEISKAKQQDKFTGTQDFIEQQPLTVDFKIAGIKKLVRKPIEQVGVHSYQAISYCQLSEDELAREGIITKSKIQDLLKDSIQKTMKVPQSITKTIKVPFIKKRKKDDDQNQDPEIGLKEKEIKYHIVERPIGIIMNVKAVGRKRTVSIESQAIIANNLQHPITLVFAIWQINQHSQKIIDQIEQGEFVAGDNLTFKKETFQEETKQMVEDMLLKQDFESDEVAEDIQRKLEEQIQAQIQQQNLDADDFALFAQSRALTLREGKAKKVIEQDPRSDNEVKIILKSGDIFRIPITWLMRDSRVDLLIQTEKPDVKAEEQSLISLYKNIQSLFNQSANVESLEINEKLKSQLIELNEDFYASVDIQGYKCMPDVTKDQNPLQYVINFNPPLLLQNLFFSPLEVIEIDKPCTREVKLKTCAKIPPKTSDYILTLDMSQDNTSWIRFVFHDRVKKLMISATIDKFFKSEYGFYLTDSESSHSGRSQASNLGDGQQSIDELTKPNIKQVSFVRHASQKEYDAGKKADGTPLETMRINMETQRKIFTNLRAYNENFDFRERHFDRSNAVKIMFYTKIMIVNKTQVPFYIDEQLFGARSNDYLMKFLPFVDEQTKKKSWSLQLNVNTNSYDNYKLSDPIDVRNIGTSGYMNIGSHDFRMLQFGISINMGSGNFNKTTIITITPRYVLLNKLKNKIMIRKSFIDYSQEKQGKKDYFYDRVGNKGEQEDLYTHDLHTPGIRKKNGEFEISNTIQFRVLSEKEWKDQKGKQEDKGREDAVPDDFWCLPFSVDDLEDFQTQHKHSTSYDEMMKEADEDEEYLDGNERTESLIKDKKKKWYEPQNYNQWHLYTRVIITMCPSDISTILIIFDEPRHEEYLVANSTQSEIKFAKFDQKTKSPFHAPITIPAKQNCPFVWNYREKLLKRIQVTIENEKQVISLDKCTEGDTRNKICKTKRFIFYGSVRLSTDGTKIITITEKKRKDKGDQDSDEEEVEKVDNVVMMLHVFNSGVRMEFSFKGFGVSLIDNKPRELLYICVNELDLEYTFGSRELVDVTEDKEEITRFMMDIGNIQIDNLVNEDMPVIFGATDYFDKNIIVDKDQETYATLAQSYKMVSSNDMKPKEFDKSGHELPRLPFLRFNFLKSKKTQEGKLGQIVRYESIQFRILEFFLAIETNIVNDNIKLMIDLLDLFEGKVDQELFANEEEYKRCMTETRDQTCQDLNASKGVRFDQNALKFDKISFGVIELGTIKAILTFKLQSKALSFNLMNPRLPGDSSNSPFLAQFASVHNAELRLNELLFIEAFISQQQMLQNLTQHYSKEGYRQILKVVGSSDMLGNPVGLFNKIGVGFVELRREPAAGMREGVGGFLKGVGKGMAGVVKGVIGGTFESVGTMSGSLYQALRESTWGEDARDGDHADNIGMGVVYGVKGLGVELYKGIGGVFTKPYAGAQREGFKGFSKGLGKGLVGLVVTPVTATLRVGESISQGIAGSANALGNLGKTRMELMDVQKVRQRPARRIDVRHQIKIYDEDMAIINLFMQKILSGFFAEQQIRFYAVLPTINQAGEVIPTTKTVVIITDQYIIYLRAQSFLDQIFNSNNTQQLLLSEKLTNILTYKLYKYDDDDDQNPKYFFKIRFKRKEDPQQDPNQPQPKKPNNSIQSDFSSHQFSSDMSSHAHGHTGDLFHDMDGNLHHQCSSHEDLIEPLMRQYSYEEALDRDDKYEFVMYSPSYEIFKRMHAILSNVPEIVQNLEEEERLVQERLQAQHKILYGKGRRDHGEEIGIEDQSAVNEGGVMTEEERLAYANYRNEERVSRAPFGMFDDADLDEQQGK